MLIRVPLTRRDRQPMKTLSPEEFLELRKEIAPLGLSDARQNELIGIIDNIVIAIIDQEFGWSAVQTSLSAKANRVFARDDSCGGVNECGRFGQVTGHDGGVTKPNYPAEHFAP